MNRRDFLGAVVAMAYATTDAPAAAPLPARNLTHVNIRVRDVAESERFYRELFGLPVRQVVGAAYALDLPRGGFISLCPLTNTECGMSERPSAGDIDHFGIGIATFRRTVTARELSARGLETVDAGSSVFVKDPNGTWVQLSAPSEPFRS